MDGLEVRGGLSDCAVDGVGRIGDELFEADFDLRRQRRPRAEPARYVAAPTACAARRSVDHCPELVLVAGVVIVGAEETLGVEPSSGDDGIPAVPGEVDRSIAVLDRRLALPVSLDEVDLTRLPHLVRGEPPRARGGYSH